MRGKERQRETRPEPRKINSLEAINQKALVNGNYNLETLRKKFPQAKK
jgi:hypothetical protein